MIVVCLLTLVSESGCRHKHKRNRPKLPSAYAIGNIAYGPNLAYGANLLDLYLPPTKGPHPLIVCIHGGGWESGDKAFFPFRQLVRKGFAAASINYRLSSQAKFPAQIVDCKLAISWLKQHAREYDIDPERIGVWGISAGGHLAALAGLTGNSNTPAWANPDGLNSNRVRAVCDWCGPTNMLTVFYQAGAGSSANGMIERLLGSPPAVNPTLAAEASPVVYANKAAPAFLIMHGTQDACVPYQQSQELNNLLKSMHVDCTLILIKGGTHGFYSQETEQNVIDFFDRNLKSKT